MVVQRNLVAVAPPPLSGAATSGAGKTTAGGSTSTSISSYRQTLFGLVLVCIGVWSYDSFFRPTDSGAAPSLAAASSPALLGLQKAKAIVAPSQDDYAAAPDVAPGPGEESTKAAGISPKQTSRLMPVAEAQVPSTVVSETNCFAQPGGCYPLVLRSGSVFVQRLPNLHLEPSYLRISAVHRDPDTGAPHFSFPPTVKRVVLDIGTNTDPDTQADWWDDKDIGMIWFEPIVTLFTHPMHEDRTRREQGLATNRVVGIPAAVAPKPGHMAIFLSAVAGCTSLLEMNDKALRDPSVMKGSFVGSDSAFPSFADAKAGFTGCIEKVSGRPNREVIPVVRGDSILNMVPPSLPIYFVATDAQGFDLQVVASFGKTLPRIDILLVECQDLPEGHGMFLTRGAFSCADVRECMKQYSPEHVMIAAATGQPADSCTINNPSHERNCLFRRPSRPWFHKLPKLLQRPGYAIKYPARENLQCPSLEAEPGAVATLTDLKDHASNWQPGDVADE